MTNNPQVHLQVHLEAGWLAVLQSQFDQPYMLALKQFLAEQKQQGKTLYPPSSQWFNSFNSTPFQKVRVVILGQDPYHGPQQAHGLCFSVSQSVAVPPSLKNIFKEINTDLGHKPPKHGCLDHWATQGVLLLNATLTVEQGKAGAHQGKGWEQFTDYAIQALSEQRQGIVFLLWGAYAQKKSALINADRHCILKAPHPSPLSAYRGFLGCQHFSKTNQFLQQHGQPAIDWSLPPLTQPSQ